ncbi:unnamed protein product [Didymodactylos carnosus]|uniref:Tetratricopeptide repeat protein n=1 Tax=Didymodactylos carnosus TaxID=1234261 RepID=A0A814V1B2_9BILA|nr:unnamed protein product [Didymodactylos carnosus]CAF3944897.1 unnamed protein product [Didymodactylos carnosus]
MVAVDGMSRNIDAIAGKNRYYATVTTREYREALKVLEDAAACKLNYSNRTYADAIEKLIVRNSEYDSALLCGKNEDNYYHLELRKFYADHRILDSEKKIIINYMLHCLPDLEKGIYRPAVTLISNDDDLVSFFKFYNGSGRENIDKDAGGMYAIIKNMEFGGMMSIRQSVIDPEAAEMSLYLREFLQNKKVGARLIKFQLETTLVFDAIAFSYWNNQDYDNASVYWLKTLEIKQQNQNQHQVKGTASIKKLIMKKIGEFYTNCLSHYKGQPSKIIEVHISIASVYTEITQYHKARQEYEQQLLFIEQNDPDAIGYHNTLIGWCYSKEKDYDHAVEHYLKNLELYTINQRYLMFI